MLDLQSYPLWIVLALFVAAAAAIWNAGGKLAAFADLISDRTGLGRAFVGLALLAVATSLPEVATAVTATAIGNVSLAVNGLFGGIVMQTAVLVIADRACGSGALTHFIVRPVVMVQGLLLIVLLALALAGIGAGDAGAFGVGIWPLSICAVYLLGLDMVRRAQGEGRWSPDNDPEQGKEERAVIKELRQQHEEWSNRRVYLAFAVSSVVILIAGTAVAQTGDALAHQTGLGGSFIGATLVAFATSLPEVSTTVAAARLGAYGMAVSNIFGSNMLMPALLLPADLSDRSNPVMAVIDPSATLAAAAGIVVTTVYLIGLIQHRNRTIAGVGLDSATVAVIYAGTLVGLYLLR